MFVFFSILIILSLPSPRPLKKKTALKMFIVFQAKKSLDHSLNIYLLIFIGFQKKHNISEISRHFREMFFMRWQQDGLKAFYDDIFFFNCLGGFGGFPYVIMAPLFPPIKIKLLSSVTVNHCCLFVFVFLLKSTKIFCLFIRPRLSKKICSFPC